MEQFKLSAEYIPLVQLLKALNWVESGGMAKMVVDEGLVAVNGQKETRKRKKLIHGDIVTMDELQVQIV